MMLAAGPLGCSPSVTAASASSARRTASGLRKDPCQAPCCVRLFRGSRLPSAPVLLAEAVLTASGTLGVLLLLPLLGRKAVARSSGRKKQRQRGSQVLCMALSEKNLQVLEDAASGGDGESAFALGKALLEGDGVEADLGKAAEWFRKAGDLGVVQAQYNLGMMLFNGHGCEADKAAGVSWLLKAADSSDLLSMYFLGILSLEGDGVEQDPDKAMHYFEQAAEGGLADAQLTVGSMLLQAQQDNQKEDEVAKATESAVHWFTKAAEQGSAQAQYSLGMLLLQGVNGQSRDLTKGAEWMSEAANQGLPEAQFMMGTLLLSGQGVEENKEWAAYWLEESAKQGHVDAQYNFGLMLEYGDGIPQDKEKARYWLKLAADQGDEDAANRSQPKEEGEETVVGAALAAERVEARTAPEPLLRVGHGFDIHRMAPKDDPEVGGPVVVGGVAFSDFELGIVAHSDGDVIYHSVVDAIFGALGLPDIGQFFPDSDPQWKGAPSKVFMEQAWKEMDDRGYCIGNVDVTLIAQAPRMIVKDHPAAEPGKPFDHKKVMELNIAELLQCDRSRVNVKARTHEKVDAVGEKRALSCHVVVALEYQAGSAGPKAE